MKKIRELQNTQKKWFILSFFEPVQLSDKLYILNKFICLGTIQLTDNILFFCSSFFMGLQIQQYVISFILERLLFQMFTFLTFVDRNCIGVEWALNTKTRLLKISFIYADGVKWTSPSFISSMFTVQESTRDLVHTRNGKCRLKPQSYYNNTEGVCSIYTQTILEPFPCLRQSGYLQINRQE